MRILGIETSCDETAAAVVQVTQGRFSVLSNVVASQVKIHAKTGGVVPEVAARAHVEKIIPVVEKALKQVHPLLNPPPSRGRNKKEIPLPRWEGLGEGGIDAIAVTAGPGLATSLLVGVEVARTLAWLWKKPVVAVNHLAGHIYANWLPSPQSSPTRGEEAKGNFPPLVGGVRGGWPVLALIVSGGHTELVLMKKHMDFKIIGETRDDAAGEAFDKVAKMLGLGYPGGPIISKLAKKGDSRAISFPRPMLDSPNFDFSFSGLKTSVLYCARDHKLSAMRINPMRLPAGVYGHLPEQPTRNDLCASFEQAVVDVLVAKTIWAAKQYKVKTVLLGGGVAANQHLRARLQQELQRSMPFALCSMPSIAYTTDNAAMVAAAGYFMARKKQFVPWQKLEVDPNWELGKSFQPITR